MADTQSLTAALIDSTTSKIQQLQQAFTELESHRAVSLNLKWKELEEHFYSLERSLKQRLDELEGQQREYETKVSETREMLEKREAVVVAKEQTLLERLQEKRDAALLAIGDAFDKYKKASVEPIANVMSNGTADPVIEEKLDVKAGGVNLLANKPAKNGDVDVMPRPELTKLCEEMDVKGLHKFISDNRKNLSAIREEIPFALKSAADPAHFVLVPGIFACIEGASVIHFQDFNAEVLQCLTIPNVKANLAKDPLLQHSSHTNEIEKKTSSEIRFFAGDWSEIHKLLSHNSDSECQQGPESSSNRDGYDIILMAETVYSLSSLNNLYELIKKCLSRPLGVVYLAAKKHYFGVGGGTRQFRHIVAEDGIMEACLIAEVADGSSNVREVWKFTLRE